MSLTPEQVDFLDKIRDFLRDDIVRNGAVCGEIKLKCKQLLNEMDAMELVKRIPDGSKKVRRRHTGPPKSPPICHQDSNYIEMDIGPSPELRKRISIPREMLKINLEREENRSRGNSVAEPKNSFDLEKSPIRGLEELDGEEPNPYSKGESSSVASSIYVESQPLLKVMGVKAKWNKRYGCIREKHLLIFQKETSVSQHLDFPLNAYNIVLKKQDFSKAMMIQIKLQGDADEESRFYVDEADAYMWVDAIKRDFSAVVDEYSSDESRPPQPPPRPPHTLPDESTSMDSPPPLPPPRTSNTLSTPSLSSPRTPVDNFVQENHSTLKRESTEDIQKCGLLSILDPLDNTWTSKICFIQGKQFQAYAGGKKGNQETKIDLQGCRLEIDPANAQNNVSVFRILQQNSSVISLKAFSKDDMAEWVGTLMAEFSSTEEGEMEQIYAECEDPYYITANTFPSHNNTELNIATRVYKRSIRLKKRLASIRRSNGQEDFPLDFEIVRPHSSSFPPHCPKPRSATTNNVFNDESVFDPEQFDLENRKRLPVPSHHPSDPSVMESLKTATRRSLLKKREELDKLLIILRVKEKELTKYYDKSVVLGACIASQKVKKACKQNKVDIELVCKERDLVNKNLEDLTRTKSTDFETIQSANAILSDERDSGSPIRKKDSGSPTRIKEETSSSCRTEIKIEISHPTTRLEKEIDEPRVQKSEEQKARFKAAIQTFDKSTLNGERQTANKTAADQTHPDTSNAEKPKANISARIKMFEK